MGVFKDSEARKAFTDRIGAEDARYLDGRLLDELVPKQAKVAGEPDGDHAAGIKKAGNE